MKNKISTIVLIILFITIGLLALYGYTSSIDTFVYNLIIKMKCDFATNLFKFISFMFSTIMVVIYCILSIFISKNKRKSIFLCFIMASEALINNIVKIIFRRPRPNVLALVVEKSYSFPSGHTMAATVFLIVISYFLKEKYNNKKVLITCLEIIMILAVMMSRIYLGVHYFTDTLGAIILSFVILLIVKNINKISNWLKEGSI